MCADGECGFWLTWFWFCLFKLEHKFTLSFFIFPLTMDNFYLHYRACSYLLIYLLQMNPTSSPHLKTTSSQFHQAKQSNKKIMFIEFHPFPLSACRPPVPVQWWATRWRVTGRAAAWCGWWSSPPRRWRGERSPETNFSWNSKNRKQIVFSWKLGSICSCFGKQRTVKKSITTILFYFLFRVNFHWISKRKKILFEFVI